MRKLDFKPKFKKEMSNIEIIGIETIIENSSKNEDNENVMPNCEQLGLAYTSSSDYAMLNVCNGNFDIDCDESDMPIYLSHFSITENNMLIMVCYDIYENNVYYEIESTDFY